MLAALLGLALIWQGAALGAQVFSVSMQRQGTRTIITLRSDVPLDPTVELKDPKTVVLHLGGVLWAAEIPNVGQDPLVASLSSQQLSGNVALVVRTKSPGVTVLPVHTPGSRSFSLELSGVAVVVKAQPPSSVKAQPKTPETPPVPPAPKMPPAKASPVQVAAKPPAPRLQSQLRVSSPARTKPTPMITNIRLGTHPGYTRVVLDSDRPIRAVFVAADRHGVIRLARGDLKPGWRMPRFDARVTGMEVERANPLVLKVFFTGPLQKHRLFHLDRSRKAVLDLTLSPDAPQPRSARPRQAQSYTGGQGQTRSISANMPPRVGKDAPAPLSEQTRRGSLPPPPEEVHEAPILRSPGGSISGAMPPPPSGSKTAQGRARPPGSPSLLAESRAKELAAREPVTGSVSPEDFRPGRSITGLIPPVPPPSPRARASGQGVPPPGTDGPGTPEAVIGLIKQSQEVAATQEGLLESTPEVQAAEQFDLAQASLDGRDYTAAYDRFKRFLANYPGSAMAGEATFRLADAFFHQHERNLVPVYDEVNENYQRGVDLYPQNDQVPWAFLMMGRAAMLVGQPHLAAGYFQLVIEDHPKSEYVPLAMVSRARAYLSLGRLNQALAQFQKVSEKYPQSRFRKDADWGQAQSLFSLGRYHRASLLLKDMNQRYRGLHLSEPELLYYIGEAEFQLKDYPEARRYFLWALNIKPGIPDNDIMLTRVGDTYQFEDALAAARDIYRQVIDLFPETDGALVSQIRLSESGEKDEDHAGDIFQVKATTDALGVYNEILRKYPDRPVAQLARLKLGVYYFKKKKFAMSLEALDPMLSALPRTAFYPEVLYTMNLAATNLLVQTRKASNAEALMNTYLAKRSLLTRPNSNRMLTMLSWAYEKMGLNHRAVTLYKVLLSRGLQDKEVILGLARNQMASRNYKGVVATLQGEGAKELEGDAAIDAGSMLGRALVETGDYQRGAQVLEKVLRRFPGHSDAARNQAALGKAYIETGDFGAALNALDRAEEILANLSGTPAKGLRFCTAVWAGSAARQNGEFSRALSYSRKAEAIALTPGGQAQALYEQGGVLRDLRRGNEMTAVWRRLAKMKVSPWSDMAERHLADIRLAPSLAQVGQ